jgi:hypothetical protein
MSDKSTSQGIIGGYTSGGGGGASTVNEIQAFPAKDINWLADSSADLWDSVSAPLAFRIDFLTKGYSKLNWFKSIFSANVGTAIGKYAIYGDGTTKLVEGALPDSPLYGIANFASIDISSFDYLAVCMDPGVNSSPQPVSQSILNMPTGPSLLRYAFAGMIAHAHNAVFPATAPALLDADLKFFLARWCAIGVS